MKNRSIQKDIAIVGVSCKFAKSNTPQEFWNNLKGGEELLDFYTEEELLELGIDQATIDNPNHVKLNTYVEGADSFDYPFFGYTKDEANLMDPQIRVLHEQVWMALEDAGYSSEAYKKRIGLYLAASENLHWIAHSMLQNNKNVDPFYLSHIINKNYVSTLISYKLNLKGPSCVLDTACSSSLMAVHVACRSLLMRECSMAIAGGASFKTEKSTDYFYQEGMIGSIDGQCRAFDDDCSGTFGGQGSGVVVLKRLQEALDDGDHIYGVIRASASNNDGNRKVGYTAPSVAGQYDCVKQALNFANVPYSDISFIEGHGTGTKLGDPIEVKALNKAFEYDTTHQCTLGSLKTNLGHLDAAAGVAGLIKATLALKNKMIPPTRHFKKANSEIKFEKGPFEVNSKLKEFTTKDNAPRMAGVNSLGIGGTNVHVILEEAPKVKKGSTSRPYQLIPYTGKTQNSVTNYRKALLQYTEDQPFQLEDLAYTLKVGRQSFKYRDFVVANTKEEVSTLLKEKLNENLGGYAVAHKKNTVFMFPGQGSQYFEMAKDVYQQEPLFKSIMDRGFESLLELTGDNYAEILGYTSGQESNPALINDTYYTQPALFLVEYALALLLMEWGIKPDHMMGHSLGEYTAACIAKVFTLEEGLALLVKRASLMNDLDKGDMLGIGISAERISSKLPDGISIATVNTANSCVVSGNTERISEFSKYLASEEIPFTKLKTSHAFHSEMMDEMLDAYENELGKINLLEPELPFISNLTGKEILAEEAVSPKYWVQHLRQTVKFKEGIETLLDKGDAVFIEVGPGRVLSTFCKQNDIYTNACATINVARHPKEQKNDNKRLTEALGEIWAHGIEIDWGQYYKEETRNKISAPTYAFDSYALDFKVEPFKRLMGKGMLQSSVQPFEEWFYAPNWKKSRIRTTLDVTAKSPTYLFFTEDNGMLTAVKNELLKKGTRVVEVKKGSAFVKKDALFYEMNTSGTVDFSELFECLREESIEVDQVVFNWDFHGDTQSEVTNIFMVFQDFCKNFVSHFPEREKKITLLNKFGKLVMGDETLNVGLNSAMQIVSICAQENPHIFSCSLDIEEESDYNDDAFIETILRELEYNVENRNVAYRNGNRWVEFFEKLTYKQSRSAVYAQPNKTYVITGGLGEVGKVFAEHLSNEYQSKVILLGRSKLPPENDWQSNLENENTDKKVVKNIKQLLELRKVNKDIYYVSADVSDANSLAEAITSIERDHGKISGIVHAAGNAGGDTYKPVENLTSAIAKKEFSPKIDGTRNIYELFKGHDLDFVWITSSLSTVLGGLTYGAYAIANNFIDLFVGSKKKELKNWFVINLDGIGGDRITHDRLRKVMEKSFDIGSASAIIISSKDPNKVLEKQLETVVIEESVEEEHILERPTVSKKYLAPTTETEKEIADVWKSFFGYQEIGILDNFFELGGDSLKAMTILKRLHEQIGVEISIEEFFQNPTIKAIGLKVEVLLKVQELQKPKTGGVTVTI